MSMNEKRRERQERTAILLHSLDPELFPSISVKQDSIQSSPRSGVVIIQSLWRGVLARKKYIEILIEEDEKAREKDRLRVEEGLRLLDNIERVKHLDEMSVHRRSMSSRRHRSAMCIQRVFHKYRKRSGPSMDSLRREMTAVHEMISKANEALLTSLQERDKLRDKNNSIKLRIQYLLRGLSDGAYVRNNY